MVYIAVWLTTAQIQTQRIVPQGQAQCFGSVCYTVVSIQTVGEFEGRGGGQLVQVGLRIANQGDAPSDVPGLEPYLIDANGQLWPRTTGLGGIPVTLRLPPGATGTSQPIFRIQGTPPGLSLILTRHHSGWHWLVIGDPDSPGHKPTLMSLPNP